MAIERTFSMIKLDATATAEAQKFYEVHKARQVSGYSRACQRMRLPALAFA